MNYDPSITYKTSIHTFLTPQFQNAQFYQRDMNILDLIHTY
jgi:hypothetical protein